MHRDGSAALVTRATTPWQVCGGCDRSPIRALADLGRRWPPAVLGIPSHPAAQADRLCEAIAAYTGKDGL